MPVEQIAESNQQEKDIKDVDIKNVENLTKEEAKKLSDEIVSSPNNEKQVKEEFPQYLETFSQEEKSDFISQLQDEITWAIDELKSLWIEEEYTPEISNKDIENAKILKFVTDNKEKIPQQWSKIEAKADEIKKGMEEDIRKEGIDVKLPN